MIVRLPASRWDEQVHQVRERYRQGSRREGAKAEITASDGTKRGPTAQEWADPWTEIPNWRPLGSGEQPQQGAGSENSDRLRSGNSDLIGRP